jgi:multicomponent Na+:H+ antiporter subunit C
MILLSAFLIAILFGCGIYLMLSRNLQRVVIGFILLSNGVNLMVLTASGLPEDAVAPLLLGEGYDVQPAATMADPLPQAFILTAIVIGLAITAFLLAMAARTFRERKSDELEEVPS